ncbi:hypothetical protein HIDPHFAB_03161 [Nocardioides sp. T2.26MG-1]|nr:hypothetical protein HIDPHFAB_03161 [Nocardioides sp. T2.26MG-1]
MPINREHVNPEALATLEEFKREIEKLGLYGSFDTPGSLKDQVRRAIESDIEQLDITPPAGGPNSSRRGAALRATYEYTREPNKQGRMQTRRQRLVVTNTGDTEAADVTFTLEPAGDEGLEAPQLLHDLGPITLAADGGQIAIPVLTHMGTSNIATITFDWSEGGEPRSSSHTISFV